MKKNLPNGVETALEFDSFLWILQILRILSFFIGKRFFYQVEYKYIRDQRLELRLVDLLNQNKLIFSNIHFSAQFDSINNSERLDKELENFAEDWRKSAIRLLSSTQEKSTQIHSVSGFGLLSISRIIYSTKNQKEIFEQIVIDWQEEYFEALQKKENDRLFMINVRNTYSFFIAMIQKSPIGDLIEFVNKFWK